MLLLTFFPYVVLVLRVWLLIIPYTWVEKKKKNFINPIKNLRFNFYMNIMKYNSNPFIGNVNKIISMSFQLFTFILKISKYAPLIFQYLIIVIKTIDYQSKLQ
jgi:hypothetical protein